MIPLHPVLTKASCTIYVASILAILERIITLSRSHIGLHPPRCSPLTSSAGPSSCCMAWSSFLRLSLFVSRMRTCACRASICWVRPRTASCFSTCSFTSARLYTRWGQQARPTEASRQRSNVCLGHHIRDTPTSSLPSSSSVDTRRLLLSLCALKANPLLSLSGLDASPQNENLSIDIVFTWK